MEDSYKEKLNALRNSGAAFKNANPASRISMAKSGAKEVRRFFNLWSQFDPMLDWLFGIALTLAILKDLLDFVGIGSLPAIGTIVTLCVSSLIGLVMLLVGARKNRKRVKSSMKNIGHLGTMKKFGVLGGGTTCEFLFGVNFLPLETITTIVVIVLTLRERAANAEMEREYQKIHPAYAE